MEVKNPSSTAITTTTTTTDFFFFSLPVASWPTYSFTACKMGQTLSIQLENVRVLHYLSCCCTIYECMHRENWNSFSLLHVVHVCAWADLSGIVGEHVTPFFDTLVAIGENKKRLCVHLFFSSWAGAAIRDVLLLLFCAGHAHHIAKAKVKYLRGAFWAETVT